jgi:GNAT superfamily N-acetyltransferase
MKVQILRTNSDNLQFIELVGLLDHYLADVDGSEHAFYDQYNKIDHLRNVVIATLDNMATSCGAMKEYNRETMEIKRMYTKVEARGRGLAGQVLKELENWALEQGYKHCLLETGKRQREAIGLYEKSGYQQIPNFGPYIGVENSLCFQKDL